MQLYGADNIVGPEQKLIVCIYVFIKHLTLVLKSFQEFSSKIDFARLKVELKDSRMIH